MLSDFVGLLALPSRYTVSVALLFPAAIRPSGSGAKRRSPSSRAGEKELVSALREVQRAGFPYVMLGRGSNVLVSDGGFDGVVIATALARAIRAENGLIVAECGVALSALLRFAAENDLGGLEYLAGIPASAGGRSL